MLSEKEVWNKSRFFRRKMMFSIFCRQMWRLSWKLKLLMKKTNWTKAKILEFVDKDDCRSFLLLLWNWVNITTKDSFLTTSSSSQKCNSYCMHCKKKKKMSFVDSSRSSSRLVRMKAKPHLLSLSPCTCWDNSLLLMCECYAQSCQKCFIRACKTLKHRLLHPVDKSTSSYFKGSYWYVGDTNHLIEIAEDWTMSG